MVATEGQVTDYQTRLTATEGQVTNHQTRLTATEGQVKDHQTRLVATEGQVTDLEKESKGNLKLMFSGFRLERAVLKHDLNQEIICVIFSRQCSVTIIITTLTTFYTYWRFLFKLDFKCVFVLVLTH